MQPMPENALSINPFENDVLVAAFTLASGEVLGYSNADFGADNLSKLDEKKSREVGRSKTETQKIGSISTPGLSNGSKSTQKGARESNGSLGGVVGPGTSNRMNPPSLVQNIQFAQTQSKTTQKQPTQPQSQSQSLQLKSEQQIAQPKLKIRLFSSSTAGGMASPVPAGPNLVIHPSVADDGGGEKKKKKKRHHEDDDPNNPDEGADHKKKKKKKKHSHHEDEAEIIID
ncbi:hypothetical protein HK100_002918 [Physocladia obscura]|uniref:Uncharacterized protein n=1 Tax=Physocladia obscura TaxID=109957 RepID=A0AAD5XAQ9_9FUNG|nr:hypothetical protein HK100_002918 [Physocladia obscura]